MRSLNRLSAAAVAKAKVRGRYSDGGGLYLQVSRWGTKAWLFRYTLNGRPHQMGLGPLHTVSLALARQRAAECRRQLLLNVDPLLERKTEKARAFVAATKDSSFRGCAERHIAAHESGWRNPKHRQQWANTLSTYAYPVVGSIAVANIDTGLVLQVLEPVWKSKPETAGRLRGRIEAVLDWAAARGLRAGENPARWRGHLDKLLPAHRKIALVHHHPALPYAAVPAFLRQLRERHGIAPRALEFTILTAARTSEAVNARWSEFKLEQAIWIIPSTRMKANREHRVPLSPAALVLLKTLPRAGDYVFPGSKADRPLSNMALLSTLKRMDVTHVTTHGFRSTFRDWAAECTSYPREVAEMALAHRATSKAEAAYQRGDLLERRRCLMADWANFCVCERTEKIGLPPIWTTPNAHD